MTGRIIAVNISDKKGVVKKPVDKALLVENHGIMGDAHAGAGIRQVSFLAKESVRKLEMQGVKGLCSGKFAENITTEGIILHKLPIGTTLYINDAILKVSKIGKECHNECEIKRLVGQCIMPTEGIFAQVIKGGEIKPNDEIIVVLE